MWLVMMITSSVMSAQDTAPQGLDERIDAWFTPISNAFQAIIFFNFPGTQIPTVVILLVLGALFFTIYFKFPNLFHFWTAVNVVRGKYDDFDKEDDPTPIVPQVNVVDGDLVDTIKNESKVGEVTHFQALATAVSGTVGLGNIAGVAIAITIGGPGATFWMVVCGLLGMSTKFVECTLGVKYRDIGPDGTVFGGPMYYLSKGLKERGYEKLGKGLAIVFAVCCVGGSCGGGNAAQSNQAASQRASLIGWESGNSGFIIGIFIAIIVGIVIIGGIKRIASVTEKIVPLMAAIYIIACLIIIGSNITFLDDAIGMIFREAFEPRAAVGGFFGVLILGFRRAVFSNEAGAGSASIAHSAVRTRYASSEGLVALMEPFIDTVVICTMTALVIIFYNSGDIFTYGDPDGNAIIEGVTYQGATLTSMAFGSVLPWFPYVLTIAIVLFAISTMISWSYYGLQSWMYLFGKSKKADMAYKVLFLIFIIIGASANMSSVWGFSDAMILGMVFPNMVGLLFLFPVVKTELTKYLKAIRKMKED